MGEGLNLEKLNLRTPKAYNYDDESETVPPRIKFYCVIEVVMSNPNFELWLLMHFPNIKQYPEEMLLENKKNLRHQLFENESKNKKYLEILVSKSANFLLI